MTRIVVIGGGTGTFTILSGLRKHPNLHLSVVVSMTDSGGSNRVIRDEFGLLPTSDLRQCMVALASNKSDKLLRKLFTYRYVSGVGISGMTFGNLFMAALTDILGSQEKAIEETCRLLGVNGSVLPVTFDNAHLVAKYENGKVVLGEHLIDEPDLKAGDQRIKKLEAFPPAKAGKKAVKALKDADLIIFGPGDLYTSIICNLVVNGITEAVRSSKAKKIYVLNLMTRFGQTNGFSATEHLKVLEKYLKHKIDTVLVNSENKFPEGVLASYKEERAFPVKDNFKARDKRVVRRDLISSKIHTKIKSDKLIRSLIRHDSEKLAKAVVELI